MTKVRKVKGHIRPFDFLQTTMTKNSWKRVTEKYAGGSQISYIFPLNDKDLHNVKDKDCHCKPRVMGADNYTSIIHNSFDGREATER